MPVLKDILTTDFQNLIFASIQLTPILTTTQM